MNSYFKEQLHCAYRAKPYPGMQIAAGYWYLPAMFGLLSAVFYADERLISVLNFKYYYN